MPEALKPCPFHAHAEPSTLNVTHSWSRYKLKLGWVSVECSYCGARGPSIILNRGMTEPEIEKAWIEEAGQRAIAAWNRQESPDAERLDWIIEMFNRPDVSTKLTGLQLGEILAGGLVRGVIHPNARAALDAARG